MTDNGHNLLSGRDLASRPALAVDLFDMELFRDTVQTHRMRVMEKLGLRTRAELIRYAVRQGLLRPASYEGTGA